MIKALSDVLVGNATGVTIVPWFRGRTQIEQSRLDQVERLAELSRLAEYRYPHKDLVGLVQCSREAGLVTRLHISGPARRPPRPVRLAGYEILEEALVNVIKHGDGLASVIIQYEPNRLTLTVDNPIEGKAPEARGARRGLKRMRHCADSVGGSFSVGPHGMGWRVHAKFPIKLASWDTGD